MKEEALCKTLSGVYVPLLTITAKINTKEADFIAPDNLEDWAGDVTRMVKKSVLVISARVHPGESNSSFLMEGLIDFLTGES